MNDYEIELIIALLSSLGIIDYIIGKTKRFKYIGIIHRIIKRIKNEKK